MFSDTAIIRFSSQLPWAVEDCSYSRNVNVSNLASFLLAVIYNNSPKKSHDCIEMHMYRGYLENKHVSYTNL